MLEVPRTKCDIFLLLDFSKAQKNTQFPTMETEKSM